MTSWWDQTTHASKDGVLLRVGQESSQTLGTLQPLAELSRGLATVYNGCPLLRAVLWPVGLWACGLPSTVC